MGDTPLTDDYVAELLKKDASRNQHRYLSNSLGGLLSRPRGNAPKPNTRFLRNIVRDADTHNAALRKKEDKESRARLRDLRRGDVGQKDEEEPRRRKEGLSPRERHHRSRRDRSQERRRSRSPRRERKHRDRSRERGNDDKKRERKHREERKKRSRSRTPPSKSRKARSPSPSSNSDSDPLQDAIGPEPPPATLPRGRGAYKDSSAIDSRFDPDYDPKLDVSLEEAGEGDDWDMALEALRDRAKWKKSGAERLRAAGFTEEEVANFEQGGGGKRGGEEGDISNVKWSKKGEDREWDRGKVIDGDHIDLKPEWGRLKDP